GDFAFGKRQRDIAPHILIAEALCQAINFDRSAHVSSDLVMVLRAGAGLLAPRGDVRWHRVAPISGPMPDLEAKCVCRHNAKGSAKSVRKFLNRRIFYHLGE